MLIPALADQNWNMERETFSLVLQRRNLILSSPREVAAATESETKKFNRRRGLDIGLVDLKLKLRKLVEMILDADRLIDRILITVGVTM